MSIKMFQSARPELLKFMNQELVIRQIVKHKEISRAELARTTGLALPSIMRIVDALVEKGVVVEIGQGLSSGGRKPQMISVNKDYMWIVGIEIAGRSIVTLADFAGNTIAAQAVDTRKDENPEQTLTRLLHITMALLDAHKISKDRVAIGVGTPGKDFKHSGPIKGFISKGWESIDVKGWFEARTDILVIVENVCRTRTLSEIWFGIGRSHPTFVYAFIDQGVGIGLVSEGLIISGSTGVAGEFGHMSIDRNGKKCYCGKLGCVEMYTSVGALEEQLSLDWLSAHTDTVEAQALLSDSAEALAFALANVVNLLNPPLIVLGGLVPRTIEPFTAMVAERLDAYVFHNLATKTRVVCSQVDNETVCLGSIALVINHILMTRE